MDKEEQKGFVRDTLSEMLEMNDIDVNKEIETDTLKFEKSPAQLAEKNNANLAVTRMKAEKFMNSLLKIYVSEGFITKSEFAQAKVNLDSMTLSKIMNQMEISESAIGMLMEEIQLGELNPKLFDSLGKLQLTFIELVKTQTAYIEQATEDYQKLAMDADAAVETPEETSGDSSGIKSNNTKDLMKMIQSTLDKK